MYRIIAHRYPNNELRVRIAPSPRAIDIFAEKTAPVINNVVEGFFDASQEGCQEIDPAIDPPALLDISFDLRTTPSPKLPAGFGSTPRPTQFGLKGRRTILRCGAVIDAENQTNETLMLVGTLPGSTLESMQAICDWSGYAIDRLKSWIAKQVRSTWSMYTWELQQRGALHLNYCVTISDDSIRDRVRTGFKKQWYRILDNITEKSGVDMFGRVDGGSWRSLPGMLQAHASECKKSVAAYISKYISKKATKHDGVFYPVRWWGCSRPLLARLSELTETIEIDKLSRGKAEAIYQDVKYELRPLAVSSYEYKDRVGLGENQVHYLYPNYVEEAWKHVMSRQPITMKKTKSTPPDQFQSSQSILMMLKEDSQVYGMLSRNLSGISKNVVMRSWMSQQLTPLELSTTIAELYSLLTQERLAGRVIPSAIARWVEIYQTNRLHSQDSRKISFSRSDEPAQVFTTESESIAPHPCSQLRLFA